MSETPKKRDVEPPVLDAIRAWVVTEDTDLAAVALKEARLALDAGHVPSLITEVAFITSLSMVEVIAMEEGLDVEAELVDVEGLEMHPVQVERLSRWAIDLVPTAEALGIATEAFMKRVSDANAAEANAPGASENTRKAQQLLGNAEGAFENRPELGTSEKAGLAGRLAALNFGKK